MKFIFCVISLCAIAIFLDFVRADKEQDLFDELRNEECALNSQKCKEQMVTKVTFDEIMGLCNAKPLETTSSKCLIECQMRQYGWLDNSGFNKDEYLNYIKQTSLGHDTTYVQAAESVANLCRDKTVPIDDSCEAAYLITKCLQDEGDKLERINLGYGIFYVEPFFYEFE